MIPATRSRVTLTLAAILAAACGHGHGSPGEEACEHFEKGPHVAVTATADPTDQSPAIASDHQRHAVSLLAVEGGHGGHVRFASPRQASWIFFLDEAVPVAFLDSAGDPIAPAGSATGDPDCDLVKGRHAVELGVGTHYLRLGPTPHEVVGLVVEPEDDEH
jgi:hypothetical protein